MKVGNLEVYGVIYKITNKVNGKVYIGQTTRSGGFKERYWNNGNGIEKVYNYHKNRKEYNGYCNDHLLKSIEKYGFESFKICEVFDIAFTKAELDIKEKSWIAIFKSNENCFGYNKTDGGVVSGIQNSDNTFSINGLCRNYTPIYCTNTDVCIKSIAELNRIYNLNIKERHRLCNSKKGVKINNCSERFIFRDLKYKGGTPVICLNTGTIYKSIRSLKGDFKNGKIIENVKNACIGEIEFIKYKNEQLYFCYAEDYFYCYDNITSEENLLKIVLNYNKYIA